MTYGPGFVLVDKAPGWTSHDVVARARRLFGMRRIGHAGTLDPMATGLLALGIHRATRLLRFVTDLPKEYEAVARFGVATDTLDADGAVVSRRPMEIAEEDLVGVLDRFIGDIDQTPPMVSAVKVGGRRLHALARSGVEVERPSRSVRVESLATEGFVAGPYPEVRFRVVGGRGLYVRVLADDLARALGGRAHLTSLRRMASGALRVEKADSIERLERLCDEGRLAEAVLSPGDGLAHLEPLVVTGDLVGAVSNGRRLPREASCGAASAGLVRVMARDRLLAVYRVAGDELVPEVVLG